MKNHIVILFSLAACTADQADHPDLVSLDGAAKSDQLNTIPIGSYKFEPTLNGQPDNGEITSLAVTASKTFQLTISDEWSGTTTHTGTYALFRKWDDTAFYIDFKESSQTTRYEYSIDVIDNATLWLHEPNSAGRWYGLSQLGGDCSMAGCPSGQSCTSCWGENVCLANGASC